MKCLSIPAILFLMLFSTVSLAQTESSPRIKSWSEENFKTYVHKIPAPQFYNDNETAYQARLKLLDMVPPSGQVQISSFTFENGKVTRQLARHICLAAARGVNVELLVDAKSGQMPGAPNLYNNTDDAKVVEDLYQYMANCGAKVYIHNVQDFYLEVLGYRIPNFLISNVFLNLHHNGSQIGPIEAKVRLEYLVLRLQSIAQTQVDRTGVKSNIKPLFSNLKEGITEFLELSTAVEAKVKNPEDKKAQDNFNKIVRRLASIYRSLLVDPLWDQVSQEQWQKTLPSIIAAMKSDIEFSLLIKEIRKYNRLSHRKMFLVRNAKNSEGCLMVGGRNLGDLYLANSEDSYLDGDVLLCQHHDTSAAKAVSAAEESFSELITDTFDPYLQESNNLNHRIGENSDYIFTNVAFPEELLPEDTKLALYKGHLELDKRLLLKEQQWESKDSAILGDHSIAKSKNWALLQAGWNPGEDEVRAKLMHLVQNESRQIYIETAYAAFDADLRAALENALSRGVQVQLVTNSFFITDGLSKLIRILMSNWTDSIRERFSNFTQLLTTYEGGHMTHFKGAIFACQKREDGSTARVFLMGSHNFDSRGGRSDKEQSLSWEEDTNCTPLDQSTFSQARGTYYQSVGARSGTAILANFSDLYEELAAVEQSPSRSDSASTKLYSQALKSIFFDSSESAKRTPQLVEKERLKKLLRTLDESGIHDFLGQFL